MSSPVKIEAIQRFVSRHLSRGGRVPSWQRRRGSRPAAEETGAGSDGRAKSWGRESIPLLIRSRVVLARNASSAPERSSSRSPCSLTRDHGTSTASRSGGPAIEALHTRLAVSAAGRHVRRSRRSRPADIRDRDWSRHIPASRARSLDRGTRERIGHAGAGRGSCRTSTAIRHLAAGEIFDLTRSACRVARTRRRRASSRPCERRVDCVKSS